MDNDPAPEFDSRYSEPGAEPPSWEQVRRVLEEAELYWLTTVTAAAGPHVTPLVGVWHEDGFCFATGPGGQKARNLRDNLEVAITTGVNTWQDGYDVVIEGTARRLLGTAELQPVAEAYRAKYGEALSSGLKCSSSNSKTTYRFG